MNKTFAFLLAGVIGAILSGDAAVLLFGIVAGVFYPDLFANNHFAYEAGWTCGIVGAITGFCFAEFSVVLLFSRR